MIKQITTCEKNNLWILQLFIERNTDLSSHYQKLEDYIDVSRKTSDPRLPNARTSFTQAHLKTLKKQLEYVSRKEGLFFDRQVTNQIFKGGFLHVRGILYRRIKENSEKNTRRNSVEKIANGKRQLFITCRNCFIFERR